MATMKRCTECDETKLRQSKATTDLEIGGRELSGEVAAQVCAVCGAVFYEGSGLVALEQEAARWLAENGFSSGEEFKFLRKTAGLRAAELAELLGVSPETVSHWETEKHTFDRG